MTESEIRFVAKCMRRYPAGVPSTFWGSSDDFLDDEYEDEYEDFDDDDPPRCYSEVPDEALREYG